jgi:hypothetical protein
MIVSKNGEDAAALRMLHAIIGDCKDRKLLSLLALDRAASIQTNLRQLEAPSDLQSTMNGMVDEILVAVEIVLANRDEHERQRR